MIPTVALHVEHGLDGGADMPSTRISIRLLGVYFNVLSMDEVLRLIATRRAGAPFAYVVTPNADYLVRLVQRQPS